MGKNIGLITKTPSIKVTTESNEVLYVWVRRTAKEEEAGFICL